MKLAEALDAPVCCNYQHNDAFPGSHPLAVGPLGYNGSKAAMELISKADVVLALGTRLNPFSTLPGYGIDYWPKNAKIIQVDINPDRIGLTKKVDVAIQADAKKAAEQLLAAAFRGRRRQGPSGAEGPDRQDQVALAAGTELDGSRGRRPRHHLEQARTRARSRPHEPAPGLARHHGGDAARTRSSRPTSATTAPSATPTRASRRAANTCRRASSAPAAMASRRSSAPRSACPDVPVIGFAGDGAFGISMNEMTACGRE